MPPVPVIALRDQDHTCCKPDPLLNAKPLQLHLVPKPISLSANLLFCILKTLLCFQQDGSDAEDAWEDIDDACAGCRSRHVFFVGP